MLYKKQRFEFLTLRNSNGSILFSLWNENPQKSFKNGVILAKKWEKLGEK